MSRWWIKEPIRFECESQCFRCCAKPGVVCMGAADIREAARFLNVPTSRFKAEYLTRENGSWFIDVEESRPCPFLTLKGCGIHNVKPAQCRTYPFWRENLESRNHWKLTAVFCPGIGQGPMIPAEAIGEILKGTHNC